MKVLVLSFFFLIIYEFLWAREPVSNLTLAPKIKIKNDMEQTIKTSITRCYRSQPFPRIMYQKFKIAEAWNKKNTRRAFGKIEYFRLQRSGCGCTLPVKKRRKERIKRAKRSSWLATHNWMRERTCSRLVAALFRDAGNLFPTCCACAGPWFLGKSDRVKTELFVATVVMKEIRTCLAEGSCNNPSQLIKPQVKQ